jgi:tetratricopeptide (TPR) repeat protein
MSHSQAISDRKHPPRSTRLLLVLGIILLAGFVLSSLSNRLKGQLYIKKANQLFYNSQYAGAVDHFLKAADLLPKDFQVRNSLGNAFYKLGARDIESNEAVILFQKAKESFQEALLLNPLDARSAYGLARAEMRVEQYSSVKEKKTAVLPTPALAALERAVELRPASTIYHLALARYLYLHNETDRFLAEITVLGRLQPTIYGKLRSEPFWSDVARRAFLSGAEKALAEEINPRQSNLIVAELMMEEERWPEAIRYRQSGMEIQPSLNATADYVRLGYLYLMDTQPKEAQASFFLAITLSKDIEQDIITILRTCRKAGNQESLLHFYREAGKVYGHSTRIDLAAARFLFNLKEYDMAGIILSESIARQPNAEVFYWQSRIAEIFNDWDTVELEIQKATVHDPQNSSYHLRFSQVLNRLQKYERAEKEAGLAIFYHVRPPAGYFHYRAGLRMRLQEYDKARADWQKAMKLDPKNQTYQQQLAKVEKILENRGQ